jgi:hypothetical protein
MVVVMCCSSIVRDGKSSEALANVGTFLKPGAEKDVRSRCSSAQDLFDRLLHGVRPRQC